MKKIYQFGFLMILVSLMCSSCQHFNTKEAVKVNDEVVEYQKALMKSLEVFVSSLETKNQSDIDKALNGLKVASENGVNKLADIESPACSNKFIPVAKEMFDYYSAASDQEYKTIAYLYGADSISYEEYDSLQLLVEQFKVEQEEVNQSFLSAQREFADDCGFKLVRNAR